MSRRVLPCGDRAILVECDSLDEVLELYATLDASRRQGVIDLVPAARTVLIGVDPGVLPLESATTWAMHAVPGMSVSQASAGELMIDVVYDGADLDALAGTLGLSVDELIARHTGATWRVAFGGFSPGFGYLVSDAWTFDVPRLASPRTRVPAGSVAVAGAFSGVYPRESPGGWQLIGRTDAPLWEADAQPPALLTPGRSVRFRAVERGGR